MRQLGRRYDRAEGESGTVDDRAELVYQRARNDDDAKAILSVRKLHPAVWPGLAGATVADAAAAGSPQPACAF